MSEIRDRHKLADEDFEKTTPPPEDKRREAVLRFLAKRGPAYSTGLRIASETGMKAPELEPVLDALVGEGKVLVMHQVFGEVKRQVFTIAPS